MPRLRDIHARYGDHPFSTADAVSVGMGRRVLANRHLRAPITGVRVAAPQPIVFAARALEALPILRPGERFSHATALALWGCPIRLPEDAPVDVESAHPMRPMRRRGIRGHSVRMGTGPDPPAATPPEATPPVPTTQSGDEPAAVLLQQVLQVLPMLPVQQDLVNQRGSAGTHTPVVPPIRALRQAAGELPFPELVVACDHLLRVPHCGEASRGRAPPAPEPLVSLADLHACADQPHGRGARRLRQAAQLAREGAESRMETLTRLRTVAAGITGLELQAEIHAPDGTFIARVDLMERRSRTILEYDGEQHRLDRRQYLRDVDRLDRLRDAGWRVLRVHAEQVLGPGNPVGALLLPHLEHPPQRVPAALAHLLEERWHVPTIRAC